MENPLATVFTRPNPMGFLVQLTTVQCPHNPLLGLLLHHSSARLGLGPLSLGIAQHDPQTFNVMQASGYDPGWNLDIDATSHLAADAVKDIWTRHLLIRRNNTGGLYPVTPPTTSSPAFLSTNQSTWHQRLSHPGHEVLRHLVANKFIDCNKIKTPSICLACQLGKHLRLPFFFVSSTLVDNAFDVVHSDLWTSPIPSVGGYKYYVIFWDHFTHFLWIYPLCNKSDVFDKFLHFRQFFDTQFHKEIKAFHYDHGGEFDNHQFRFSYPHTSHQNGKSERMIQTINNIIRTFLFQDNLPSPFWVESLDMTVHLLNILPSTSIKNNIPYTKLFNKLSSYTHLRTFGSLCYPHIFIVHKLQPQSTKCIF